jgi:hypothetical protein
LIVVLKRTPSAEWVVVSARNMASTVFVQHETTSASCALVSHGRALKAGIKSLPALIAFAVVEEESSLAEQALVRTLVCASFHGWLLTAEALPLPTISVSVFLI